MGMRDKKSEFPLEIKDGGSLEIDYGEEDDDDYGEEEYVEDLNSDALN